MAERDDVCTCGQACRVVGRELDQVVARFNEWRGAHLLAGDHPKETVSEIVVRAPLSATG